VSHFRSVVCAHMAAEIPAHPCRSLHSDQKHLVEAECIFTCIWGFVLIRISYHFNLYMFSNSVNYLYHLHISSLKLRIPTLNLTVDFLHDKSLSDRFTKAIASQSFIYYHWPVPFQDKLVFLILCKCRKLIKCEGVGGWG